MADVQITWNIQFFSLKFSKLKTLKKLSDVDFSLFAHQLQVVCDCQQLSN